MAQEIAEEREGCKPMLAARLRRISPDHVAVAETDPRKIAELVDWLRDGGPISPVVAVDYGGKFIPIDGHHRLAACVILGRDLMAWVVGGEDFEDFDAAHRHTGVRAEDCIDCGGKSAWQVAT